MAKTETETVGSEVCCRMQPRVESGLLVDFKNLQPLLSIQQSRFGPWELLLRRRRVKRPDCTVQRYVQYVGPIFFFFILSAEHGVKGGPLTSAQFTVSIHRRAQTEPQGAFLHQRAALRSAASAIN